MINLVSTLWVAVIVIQTIECRPSASLENDKSGKFGYKYEVSHSPGASNVHLTFGKSKLDQKSYDNPERDSKTYQYEPSASYQPTHPGPASYPAEIDAKHHGKSDSAIYDPSISSGGVYASPYNSERKQGEYSNYGEDNGPKYSPESHTSNFHPLPDVKEFPESQYSHPEVKTSHLSNSNEAGGPYYPNPTSQNHVDVPVHSSNPHYPVQTSNPTYHPQQGSTAPTYSGHLNHAQEHPQYVSTGQHIDGSTYTHDLNLARPPSHAVPLSQHISIQSPPIGAKYAIVPSGPPYTKDTFTAEIIHGPQTGEAIPVSGASLYESNKPAPVSHSILLPYGPTDTHPVSELSQNENIPLPLPDSHINSLPPTSLSTQLLIPAAVNPIDSVSSQNTPYQPQEKLDIAPISHSTQLILPSPALPSNPTQIDLGNPYISSPDSIKHAPILSHSSQIILPVAVPQIDAEVSKTVPSGFISEKAHISSQDKNFEDISPVSHSTQLLLPTSSAAEPAPIEPFHFPEQTAHGLAPISPPSHSTRLLIPSDPYHPKQAEAPEFMLHLDDGYTNIAGPSSSHQFGLFPEPESKSFVTSPDVSPISHSFRLNVPQLTPGVLPVIPDEKPGGNIAPIVVDSPLVDKVPPPPSHSFKLILPEPYVLPDLLKLGEDAYKDESYQLGNKDRDNYDPTVTLARPPTPTEQDVIVPQIQYSEPSTQTEDSKSVEVPVSAKRLRRKGRKLRKIVPS